MNQHFRVRHGKNAWEYSEYSDALSKAFDMSLLDKDNRKAILDSLGTDDIYRPFGYYVNGRYFGNDQ